MTTGNATLVTRKDGSPVTMRSLRFAVPAAVLLLVAAATSARAQDDHRNIQEDLPLQIEDASPIEPGKVLLQNILRWDRIREEGRRLNRYWIEPRVQIGVSKSFDLIVVSTFYKGNASQKNSGDVRLEGLYNFQPETRRRPALAVSLRADAPSGKQSRGVDSLIELHVSRSLVPPKEPGDDTQPQLHLNVGTNVNTYPLEDELTTGYRFVIGYSKPVFRHTTFVADFYSEQEPKDAKREHLLGIGARHQTGRTVLTFGASAGIGPQSLPVSLTVGTQYAL